MIKLISGFKNAFVVELEHLLLDGWIIRGNLVVTETPFSDSTVAFRAEAPHEDGSGTIIFDVSTIARYSILVSKD